MTTFKILSGEIKWASGNKTVIQLVNEFKLNKYIVNYGNNGNDYN